MVSTTVVFLSAARRRITSHVNRRLYGSIPLVGCQVRRSVFDESDGDDNFRRWPQDSFPWVLSFSESATSATADTTASTSDRSCSERGVQLEVFAHGEVGPQHVDAGDPGGGRISGISDVTLGR